MLSALAVLALCVAPSIAISLPPPSFSLNPNFTDPLALDRQTLYPFGDFQSGKDSLTSVTPKLFRRNLYRRDKPTTDNLVVSWAKSNVSSASHADKKLFASRIATSEILDLLNGAVDSSGKDHVPGDTTNYFHYNTSSWVYSILVPNTTIEYRAIRAISKILLSHVNSTTTQTLTFAANLLSNDIAIADITFLPSAFPTEPLNTTGKPSVAQNERGEVNIQTFLQHGIYNNTEPYNSSQSLITYLSNATNHDKRSILHPRFSPADTQLDVWQTQIAGATMYLTYRNFRDGFGYMRRTFTKYYLESISLALTSLYEKIAWAEHMNIPEDSIYVDHIVRLPMILQQPLSRVSVEIRKTKLLTDPIHTEFGQGSLGLQYRNLISNVYQSRPYPARE